MTSYLLDPTRLFDEEQTYKASLDIEPKQSRLSMTSAPSWTSLRTVGRVIRGAGVALLNQWCQDLAVYKIGQTRGSCERKKQIGWWRAPDLMVSNCWRMWSSYYPGSQVKQASLIQRSPSVISPAATVMLAGRCWEGGHMICLKNNQWLLHVWLATSVVQSLHRLTIWYRYMCETFHG